MDKEDPGMVVHHRSGTTVLDDPDDKAFQDFINNHRQHLDCAEDFKQSISFIQAHYPKFQIDCHLKEGGRKIPEHCSYTYTRTMFNEIYAMVKQLPKWKQASICTRNGGRFLYFRDLVNCAWYLLCLR